MVCLLIWPQLVYRGSQVRAHSGTILFFLFFWFLRQLGVFYHFYRCYKMLWEHLFLYSCVPTDKYRISSYAFIQPLGHKKWCCEGPYSSIWSFFNSPSTYCVVYWMKNHTLLYLVSSVLGAKQYNFPNNPFYMLIHSRIHLGI